ncbi:5'-3' exonuclease [Psychrobacillus psychrodurans]|uniref:5'-3' exonuclease n=1 Tax=Psychrobacillus TaxID=1221880 RepID=UPI0008E7F61F|nr:5'-3' exonuclease [Psychrobacillus psychrodurans]MCK1998556.1 5'-3' exonuclease [Psychrobacillus psychrodurans]MCZ8540355.1 5'-3' exonuclease [Psychrobacillus psychrodurans]SFM59794.1 5'-3' exonuclease [Psychrobacillus psychrodurans]
MTQEKPHVLVIDGMALLFRSFFATAMSGNFFKNDKGIPTNAVQGFARHVLAAQTLMQPTHMAVCWDKGMLTFRNELYDGYKANRPKPAEELIPQFDMAQELSEHLGWMNFGIAGMEADDTIASITHKWKEDARFTIVSGDKDLLQLLEPSTEIAFTKKGFTIYDVYNEARFLEEYGISPLLFPDVKAFMGDSSDGYAGVKGIGPKTALQLVQTYGTVDKVLEALPLLKAGQRTKIETDLEMLKLSKELATIRRDVPIGAELEHLLIKDIPSAKHDFLYEHGYTILARQLQK